MWLGTWTNGASAAVTTLSASPTECPSRVIRKNRSVGARLIALEDRLGQHVEVFVLPDILSRFSSIATLPRIAAGYDLEPIERTARFAGT